MGKVKVDELTGFSQPLAPQLLVESDEEAVDVAALRGSITRFGTAMSIIDSILAKTRGTRAVNLTIFAACPVSIMSEAKRPRCQPDELDARLPRKSEQSSWSISKRRCD